MTIIQKILKILSFWNWTTTSEKNSSDVGQTEKVDCDYMVAYKDDHMFIKTDDFMIEVRDVKFTAPPENWTEKGFGIVSYTYDIHHGEKFIESMDSESFDALIGPWVQGEIEKQTR